MACWNIKYMRFESEPGQFKHFFGYFFLLKHAPAFFNTYFVLTSDTHETLNNFLMLNFMVILSYKWTATQQPKEYYGIGAR